MFLESSFMRVCDQQSVSSRRSDRFESAYWVNAVVWSVAVRCHWFYVSLVANGTGRVSAIREIEKVTTSRVLISFVRYNNTWVLCIKLFKHLPRAPGAC